MYIEAASLLMERFPTLGLLSGTWEESIPPLDLNKVELLYVYGLGAGAPYFQCKEWLKAKSERRLVFLEDELSIISAFLHLPQAVEILSEPQVHIELFTRKKKEIETLAARFPEQRVEVTCLPSKKGLKSLRLQLFRETALSHALHLDRLHGYQLFDNFVKNISHIPRSFYANKLQNAFANVPAIVCGAGPSLQSTVETLRSLENKALIIAGGSTLAALSSQGVLPHFGMAIDPNLEEYHRLKNSLTFEVPLLYSTRLHHKVFQACNGPLGYLRAGIGGSFEFWLEKELGLLDPLIGDHLSFEAISVTSICIAWAQFLGCNPILLNGIDMAYTGNKQYAPGVLEKDELAFQAIEAEKLALNRIVRRKDKKGKFVYTAIRWLMESASISHFAKQHPATRFINTTEGGIGFQGIDYQPLAETVNGFLSQELRKRVLTEISHAPMPTSAKGLIEKKMAGLKESLERVIGHLRILSKEKEGSAALAETEIQEEVAYSQLFYDIYQIFKADDFFWSKWLELALKYQAVLLQEHFESEE